MQNDMKLLKIKVTPELLADRVHTEDTYLDQLGNKRYVSYHRDHVVLETETNIVILRVGDYITIPTVAHTNKEGE